MTEKLRLQHGQAIIELAFIFPFLLIVILGIIEFSIIFYDKAMVTNASREGARTAMAFRTDLNPPNYWTATQAEDAAKTAVTNYMQTSYMQTRFLTFGATSPPTTAALRFGTSPQYDPAGGTVEVTVTYQYRFLAIPKFAGWGDTLNISSKTIMRLE